MRIYNYLLSQKETNQKVFALLIDPDKMQSIAIPAFIEDCNQGGVDIILIGGSLVLDVSYEEKILQIKALTSIPLIIFPGNINQISAKADALLFLSLISGRNPEYLIGNQVISAPILKKMNLETISTAYMLIESGTTTSVEFMSGSKPIPREKVDIAIAHALAAEFLGFKLIYLEAGSGAKLSIPSEMVRSVANSVKIPVIVGGGITSPQMASEKVKAGADIIVIGNHFENTDTHSVIKEFSEAIHL